MSGSSKPGGHTQKTEGRPCTAVRGTESKMTTTMILAATVLAVTAMLCLAGSRAWRGWLELKRLELSRAAEDGTPDQDVGVRIELAAVRERLKKLEEIASGVEL